MEKTTIGLIICTLICVLVSVVSIGIGFWLAPGYIMYKAVKALIGFIIGVVVILILFIAYKTVGRQ